MVETVEKKDQKKLSDQDVSVFDCWERKWIKDPTGPFLVDGAGIVQIRGSEALQAATSITFVVNYANGESEPFPPISYSSGRKPVRKILTLRSSSDEDFRTRYPVGTEELGTVTWVDQSEGKYALVQLPGGDTGILHYTEMNADLNEFVDVSKYVDVGDKIRVKIIRIDPREKRIQLRFLSKD